MNIKKTILDFIKPLILASIALAGVALVQGYTTWNEPTASPVGNNPDAPINVGDNTQTKIGNLIINAGTNLNGQNSSYQYGLQVFGTSVFENVQITGGSPSAGKVLVAKDTDGNTEWQTVTSNTIAAPDLGPSFWYHPYASNLSDPRVKDANGNVSSNPAVNGTGWVVASPSAPNTYYGQKCPTGYYVDGVVEHGNCSGGACGVQIHCARFPNAVSQ